MSGFLDLDSQAQALLNRVFAGANDRAASAARAAVAGALDELSTRLPALGEQVRGELNSTIASTWATGMATLLRDSPGLRAEIVAIAREAGGGLAEGAVNSTPNALAEAAPWIVGGVLVAAAIAATLYYLHRAEGQAARAS